MHPLYSMAQIRAIEYAAYAGLPAGTLMERAGLAASNAAQALLSTRAGPVLVLAGPGNNGGDALAAAANLAEAGVPTFVILVNGGGRSPEAAQALSRARASSARFIDDPAQVATHGPDWALALDGLFGIGLQRPLDGAARDLVMAVKGARRPVLALDVPSGLDADSGALVGAHGVAVVATHTLTFIGDKPGLHTFMGRDHAGTVTLATLDIAPSLFPLPQVQLGEAALFAHCLQPRAHATHKGSFGDVAILGGAPGMLGAALLAARAALFSGAGRVFVAALGPAPPVDSLHPEIMLRDAAGYDGSRATLVAGPGMGDSAPAPQLLAKAIDGAAPLVLDADALNLIAAGSDLQGRLACRSAPTILTPHPLEAARLLGVTAALVQQDRLAAAHELAERFNCIVVLKGSGTLIARPPMTRTGNCTCTCVINPTGNPGLASGGTGDVLAGLTGSLLAQGWPAWEAALGAVWLHGTAADRLVEQGVGPIGMTAGELAPALRQLLNGRL